jgi:hypothetical protein
MPKRVIVCGGRDYADVAWLDAILSTVWRKHPDAELVEGGARGADRLAAEWATARGVPHLRVPADWDRYGKAAGPRRNEAMAALDGVVGVVAFPGGNGTKHMVRTAKARGLPVYEVPA